jgi:flavin-dependent dehydrogenase
METLTTPTDRRGGSAGSFDLIVIGGGPAGTSAAITAARGGASVLLLERGKLPRHRVCGEFVSAESLSLLANLLSTQADALLQGAPRIRSARLFVDGRVISTEIDPPAASIARFDLDQALWKAALRAGVDARTQTHVEQVEGHGPFRVRTSAGPYQCQTAMNATGRWSNLTSDAHAVDASGKRWLGIKAHYQEPSPSPSVDLYFLEGGYCGVQPVQLPEENCGTGRGRVNACAMVRADVASSLPEIFARHPGLAERSRQWEELMEPVSTSPLIFREPQPIQDGIFHAGDAAGFVDPFVGDGISLALRSGTAAADCILQFLHSELGPEAAQSRYAEIYQRRLLPVFRNSSRLRRLLDLPRAVRAPLARVLAHTPALTSYLVRSTR